jgi:hemerythrin
MSKSNQLVWKKEFLLGIEPLDRQHKSIFECLLALENSIEKRDPWNVVGWLIADLGNKLAAHISAEETLLEIVAYPGLVSHRAQHGQISTAIKELERALIKSMTSDALVPFFEQWFVCHVLSDDRSFIEYLKPIIRNSRSQFPASLAQTPRLAMHH